jgi:hypothetical protein
VRDVGLRERGLCLQYRGRAVGYVCLPALPTTSTPHCPSTTCHNQVLCRTTLCSLPGPRVPWRYAVLSNMILMLSSPPAASSAAAPLVSHCWALLSSDMLLLRQIGAAGLCILLSPTAAATAAARQHGGSSGVGRGAPGGAGVLAGPEVIQQLKQVGSAADRCCRVTHTPTGGTLLPMHDHLIDHAEACMRLVCLNGEAAGAGSCLFPYLLSAHICMHLTMCL